MSCRHLAAIDAGLAETNFTIDASRVTFGRGALDEVGDRTRAHGATRVALFTDPRIRTLEWFAIAERSLRAAGCDVVVFDEVAIEPTETSWDRAIAFARETHPDAYVSLGGGSVIDTCKAANLYATFPAELRAYVNAPVGDGRTVPGPLAPHVACPTTSGTGSEVTGIAIFDWTSLHAKTGIASPRLRPTEAIVDPRVTATLPGEVVAASGMDVLCHALESFTARSFTTRARATPATARPASQGANPWSDLGCREAIRIAATYLVRAVRDGADTEARDQIMWAATLAGIAFGNAGVHAPHAMAYAIAGRVRDYQPRGYPAGNLVPHGMAVALGAPSVFRAFARFAPERHADVADLLAPRAAASLLGADVRGAAPADGGDLLAASVVALMRDIGMPNGISGVGYGEPDLDDLVAGTLPQKRLLANAPCEIDAACARDLFAGAMLYW